MDVPGLLHQAADLVPGNIKTEAGITVDDARDYLGHNEWEVALDLLVELGDVYQQSPGFWGLLAEAARQMRLGRSVAWCDWRCWEARNGIIRADLELIPTEAGGRQAPIPGDGQLRPMWNIGNQTTSGEPALNIARIWVEFTPDLKPGERTSVRLAPLEPHQWRHLTPGDVITMHETKPVVGRATIIEAWRPQDPEAGLEGEHGIDPDRERALLAQWDRSRY
jgi:hypothetical protein